MNLNITMIFERKNYINNLFSCKKKITSIIFNNTNINISLPVIIQSNLIITGGSTLLVNIGLNYTTALITVQGCANFTDATLVVNVTGIGSGHYEIPIINSLSSCSSSTNTKVKIISGCGSTGESFDGFNVLFDVSCGEDNVGQDGLSVTAICLVVIIPVLCIIGAVFAVRNFKLQQKFMPFRDNEPEHYNDI